MLLTLELNETILRCEIAGIRSGIETVRRLYPEVGADSIEVAGGLAAFTGVNSPLTQAYGVGAREPVSRDDVERLSEFFESRGATPRVFVTPLSDASLGRMLTSAGYAPYEYENVLASEIDADSGVRDERITVAADRDAWARASAISFTGRDVPEPADIQIASVLAWSNGGLPLEARQEDAIVATAEMDLRDGCAGLFAGSTMPAFRGKGWHRALIYDRIARAREAGATLVRATAKAGSTSEHNFVRCGFAPLYTRVLWERPRPAANSE